MNFTKECEKKKKKHHEINIYNRFTLRTIIHHDFIKHINKFIKSDNNN